MAGTGGGCGCPGCRAKTGGCSPKTMIQIWKKYSEYSDGACCQAHSQSDQIPRCCVVSLNKGFALR